MCVTVIFVLTLGCVIFEERYFFFYCDFDSILNKINKILFIDFNYKRQKLDFFLLSEILRSFCCSACIRHAELSAYILCMYEQISMLERKVKLQKYITKKA